MVYDSPTLREYDTECQSVCVSVRSPQSPRYPRLRRTGRKRDRWGSLRTKNERRPTCTYPFVLLIEVYFHFSLFYSRTCLLICTYCSFHYIKSKKEELFVLLSTLGLRNLTNPPKSRVEMENDLYTEIRSVNFRITNQLGDYFTLIISIEGASYHPSNLLHYVWVKSLILFMSNLSE